MIRQKLALVENGAPSVSLSRMNGFSPVRTTRFGSATGMFCYLPAGLCPRSGTSRNEGTGHRREQARGQRVEDKKHPVARIPADRRRDMSTRGKSGSGPPLDGPRELAHPNVRHAELIPISAKIDSVS